MTAHFSGLCLTWIQQQDRLEKDVLFGRYHHLRHLLCQFSRDGVEARRNSKLCRLHLGALEVIGKDDAALVWDAAESLVKTDDVKPCTLQ